MADKEPSFSFLSRTPSSTVNRLKGSEKYHSFTNSVILHLTGNGCDDHLTSIESSVPIG